MLFLKVAISYGMFRTIIGPSTLVAGKGRRCQIQMAP
jgi:hypothetical protein